MLTSSNAFYEYQSKMQAKYLPASIVEANKKIKEAAEKGQKISPGYYGTYVVTESPSSSEKNKNEEQK